MPRKVIAAICCASALSWVGPGAAAECSLKSPERSVFDLVLKPADEKVGTAFVVDADLGLFATAYHVLGLAGGPTGSAKLVLRRGGFEVDFERVASGNDVGVLHEDWALLKAKLKDPAQGLNPTPAMHVAYDRPNAAALTASNVFVTSGSIRQVLGAEWSATDDPVKACDALNVVMLEIPSYDRGYSGSPVFGEQQCGISGISSRFILPKDASSPGLKEAVRAFQNYTKRVDADRAAKLSAQELSLDHNFELLRELVKDKVFVKIVPSRCLIDGILVEGYKNSSSPAGKLLGENHSETVKRVVLTLNGLDLDDVEAVTLTIDMLRNAPLRWVELLQVVQAFRKISTERGFTTKNYNGLLQSALVEKQTALSYRFVEQGYRRAAAANGVDIPVDMQRASLDDTIGSVLALNAGTGSIDKIRIDADTLLGGEFAPEKRIELGIKLNELASKPSIPSSARRFARRAGLGYIASGLADESRPVSADLRGEALAQLAQTLDPATLDPNTDVTDLRSWLNRTTQALDVANLQKRVGEAALAESTLSDWNKALANGAVARAEAFRAGKSIMITRQPNGNLRPAIGIERLNAPDGAGDER